MSTISKLDGSPLDHCSLFPWTLHEGGTSVVDAYGRVVASCGFIPHKAIFEERANAELISILPEIVSSLKDLVKMVDDKNNGDFSGAIPLDEINSVLARLIDAV